MTKKYLMAEEKEKIEEYDFEKVEEEVLEFWKKRDIYPEKVKEKNREGERWYFLDGPPYTSGKVHVGTAWNKTLKDTVLRFKRMQGFDVWDRAGYDMHGLPTALELQKDLGLKTKEDVKKYGVDNFIKKCKEFSIENMEVMNQDFKRMGVWMDFENAYQTLSDEYIEGEWWLIKKAHENNRLYEGLRTMTWCPDCATALAKHECEYQTIEEPSVFVKFKVLGEEDTYLIIWTTTPWTIPFNLAVMVNPELDYVKCEVEGEKWIIAKELSAPFIKKVAEKDLNIIEEFKGEEMEGMKYQHPFHEEIPHYKEMELEHPKLHTVLLSQQYVDTSAGSGLVHCAPGCGPEDYEVGVRNNLPAYNTLDEEGVFSEEMGVFAGKTAKEDEEFFIEQLREKEVLIANPSVEHDYAHCWRCDSPVIFRTTVQWFFKTEDIKQELIKKNDQIEWVPEAAYNAFDSWLKNLRDNSITKQRFWGAPVPIWKCEECDNYTVIGSKKELKEKAGELPEDLHKPWIDEVTIECDCGAEQRRIEDVLDVWVDAGTASWNCLGYPEKEEDFQEMFPADFILEGKDQIRGWFNMLHVASMISHEEPSFKTCYMHGFVNDATGRKMSKSKGNFILPEEVIDEYGADTMRYYMVQAASPGIDMNYNFEDISLKHRHLFVIWNLHKFIIDLERSVDLEEFKTEDLDVEERYILSKLHTTMKETTKKLESYHIDEVPNLVEDIFLELSRTYIQFVREKARTGSEEEKKKVLYTSYTVFIESLKMFSIITPFISEKMFLNFKESFPLKKESIALYDWPEPEEERIDRELEEEMELAKDVITAGLAARNRAELGVRWPVSEIRVSPEKKSEDMEEAVSKAEDLIKKQLNCKEISFKKMPLEYKVKPDYSALGEDFGSDTGRIGEKIKKDSDKIGGEVKKIKKEDEEKGISIEVLGFTLTEKHLESSNSEKKRGWREEKT